MTTPRNTHESDPSPKLGRLSGPLPRALTVASVAVPAIILLLAILASALPYPPEPSQSIMRHLLGF